MRETNSKEFEKETAVERVKENCMKQMNEKQKRRQQKPNRKMKEIK